MLQFLAATDAATSTASLLSLFVPMILIVVFMYLIIYLPQKKQDKKDGQMRNSIEIGDEVTTIGGIIGRVSAIKEDTFVLETGSDRVKIRFRRSAISAVEKLDMGTAAEKDKDKKEISAKK
ncbi:MAG: preprotein translocase subunit YajC [Gemmiger sp.]|nr:preprotein translocase subunit YajC [Gemmiger sp.]